MTTNNDHDNRHPCYKKPPSDINLQSSDQSLSFVKLSSEILKPNSRLSAGAKDEIQELNQTFSRFLPNEFNFSKVVPPHRLLPVLRKCQAALDEEYIDGAKGVDFSLAIRMLEPLWYNDLVRQLERQQHISPLLIEIFLSGFIHQTQYLKLDSDRNISPNGIPESYDFYDFILDEAAERVDLMFKCTNMDIKDVELRWEGIKILSALGIEFKSPFLSGKTFPDLDEILEDSDDIPTRILIRECAPEKGSEFYQVDTTNPFHGYFIAGL